MCEFDEMGIQEPDIDSYTDAVIEDTVHCRICGGSFVLGCGEAVIVHNHTICCDCAKAAGEAYKQELRDAGVCEHGRNVGKRDDWCGECESLDSPVRGAFTEGYMLACGMYPQLDTWILSESRKQLFN